MFNFTNLATNGDFCFNEGPASVEVRRNKSRSPWSYVDLDSRQREIAERVKAGNRGGLLISEVSPVITQGRRTPSGDLLQDSASLIQLGIDLYSTDRGGLATYHGPGQWVVFPVDRLESLTGDSRGVRKAVDGLLEVAYEVGKAYHSDVEVRQGTEMGVWTPRGKFASVGVHIEQGVLLHGLAVNGFRTSTSFQGIRPCGLDAPVDFLLSEPSEDEFQILGGMIVSAMLQKFWK